MLDAVHDGDVDVLDGFNRATVASALRVKALQGGREAEHGVACDGEAPREGAAEGAQAVDGSQAVVPEFERGVVGVAAADQPHIGEALEVVEMRVVIDGDGARGLRDAQEAHQVGEALVAEDLDGVAKGVAANTGDVLEGIVQGGQAVLLEGDSARNGAGQAVDAVKVRELWVAVDEDRVADDVGTVDGGEVPQALEGGKHRVALEGEGTLELGARLHAGDAAEHRVVSNLEGVASGVGAERGDVVEAGKHLKRRVVVDGDAAGEVTAAAGHVSEGRVVGDDAGLASVGGTDHGILRDASAGHGRVGNHGDAAGELTNGAQAGIVEHRVVSDVGGSAVGGGLADSGKAGESGLEGVILDEDDGAAGVREIAHSDGHYGVVACHLDGDAVRVRADGGHGLEAGRRQVGVVVVVDGTLDDAGGSGDRGELRVLADDHRFAGAVLANRDEGRHRDGLGTNVLDDN